MKEFCKWTIYGFRVCLIVTLLLGVIFSALWGGSYLLFGYNKQPLWSIPLGIVIYFFGAALSFGLIRQIILEIKRYPKKPETYISKEETLKEEIPKEETILLSRKSKRSSLEILGLFFIFGSIIGILIPGIRRENFNPLALLIDIILNPVLVVGLIIFLYGRVRRLKK